MNPFPRWLSVLLGYLLALLIAVIALVQLNSLSQSNLKIDPSRTLTITGTATVDAVPDLAVINGSVLIEGATAQAVKTQSVQKGNDVTNALIQMGIDRKDVKTNYYLSPKYSYINGNSNISGYTANETFEIKVRDVQNAGNVIDVMTNNGVNQVGNVSYTFSYPDKSKQDARIKALQNAKDKAQQLADTAGIALGRVISFQENSPSYPIPYPMYGAMGAARPQSAAAAPPQLEAGTNRVTADVSVTFQLQ